MEAVPQPQEMTMSLFDLFLKGGALMWVLLALSIIAIYHIHIREEMVDDTQGGTDRQEFHERDKQPDP